MRHMTFLRVYQPLNKLPEKVRGLAREATKLSRADIEAEAAERLNHRLRPDTFSTVPSSSLPPIIRVLEGTDYRGKRHQFFHVNYLARATFSSIPMRREYFHDDLYNRLVTTDTLDRLEKISELQADEGFVSRSLPTFNMDVWRVPLQWLTAFSGATRENEIHTTTESIVGGTKIVRRVRDIQAVVSQLRWVHQLLVRYGPEGSNSLYARQIAGLYQWLAAFGPNQFYQGLVELDYGALSKYFWPDEVGKTLEIGHEVLERLIDIAIELEGVTIDEFPGFPPAMLKKAANIMHRQYNEATKLMEHITRHEHAN